MQVQTDFTKTMPGSFIEPEAHWYAAYTRPNHEKRVAEQLDLRNIQQLLPLHSSIRQWKDRKVRRDVPLFPGYVFVHISLQDRLRVLELPGVASFVGFGHLPARLPQEDILGLESLMKLGSNVAPSSYLCVGDRVRVINGPFQGLQGFILSTKNRTRLVLSFDSIRCSATLEIDQLDLESLGYGTQAVSKIGALL